MISYFDATENVHIAPQVIGGEYEWGAIETQLIGGCGVLTPCNWVFDKSIPKMLELYDKCLKQPTFDATDAAFDETE